MFFLTHDQRHGAHHRVCVLVVFVSSYASIFGTVFGDLQIIVSLRLVQIVHVVT